MGSRDWVPFQQRLHQGGRVCNGSFGEAVVDLLGMADVMT